MWLPWCITSLISLLGNAVSSVCVFVEIIRIHWQKQLLVSACSIISILSHTWQCVLKTEKSTNNKKDKIQEGYKLPTSRHFCVWTEGVHLSEAEKNNWKWHEKRRKATSFEKVGDRSDAGKSGQIGILKWSWNESYKDVLRKIFEMKRSKLSKKKFEAKQASLCTTLPLRLATREVLMRSLACWVQAEIQRKRSPQFLHCNIVQMQVLWGTCKMPLWVSKVFANFILQVP